MCNENVQCPMKMYNVQWKGTMCNENVQCAMKNYFSFHRQKLGVQWEIWCAMKHMVCNCVQWKIWCAMENMVCNGVQWEIWNKLCFSRGPSWHREGYHHPRQRSSATSTSSLDSSVCRSTSAATMVSSRLLLKASLTQGAVMFTVCFFLLHFFDSK